jgi:hypothetical protein|tara:strand:- start:54 stop:203 length:150 start_codon:yes stop_codon:yes gene_type:complete
MKLSTNYGLLSAAFFIFACFWYSWIPIIYAGLFLSLHIMQHLKEERNAG